MATKKNSKRNTKDDGALPIYAIARALDMSSKELRETISSWEGIEWDVSSHMKKLDAAQQAEIEQRLGLSITGEEEAPKKAAKKPSAKKQEAKSAAKKDDAKQEDEAKKAPKKSAKKKDAPKSEAKADDKDDAPQKSKKSRSKKSAKQDDAGEEKAAAKQDVADQTPAEPEPDYVAIGKEWLVETLENMGFSHPRVSGKYRDPVVEFTITGADTGKLIRTKNAAAHTAVVESFQQIMDRVVFGSDRGDHAVLIDVQGFRRNRVDELQHAADVTAAYVRKTGNKLRFAAMNAFDRRAMFVALRDEEDIKTDSQGYGVRCRLEAWADGGGDNQQSSDS